jgi:hypothetical protein
MVAPEEVQRLAKPGDLAIFYSEHFHRFRNAWYQLRQAGCHTLYAIDGILEWRNAWENSVDEPACPWAMRPILSDKVACIGNSQARILAAWGNHGKTEVTGLPRLDSIFRSPTNDHTDAASKHSLRILVTTAKWPAFTPEQRDLVRRSLVDLYQFSLAHAEIANRPVQWTWRLTGGLAADIGVENSLSDITGRELCDVLDTVDVVITTPSTVMLESMLKGRPTAILDYTNSPAYVPAAWHITAREHITRVLRQLACPTAARQLHQRIGLADALQMAEPASVRMADLCHAMIRIAHDCRAAGQPVAFPEQILPPIPSQPLLDHQTLYPDISTSGKAVSAEFDALATENQRQLGVLQRRVALLESELSRAAEGFQKIANHPILGPLLKVRQTAIRFGNQIGQVLTRENDKSTLNEAAVEATSQPLRDDMIGESNSHS